MGVLKFKNKVFKTDTADFLLNFKDWSEEFSEGLAGQLKIETGLTPKHWEVIGYIRKTFEETGRCPAVYQTCRMNNLRLKGLKDLFPTGYLRGACKLAGITYRESGVSPVWLGKPPDETKPRPEDRVYNINAFGFLLDPLEWDEEYCKFKAEEMKIPGGLTEQHWRVIKYLRRSFEARGEVPTILEICDELALELEDLETLFPDGYHRGAVKLAGLRAR